MDEYKLRVEKIRAAETIALYAISMNDFVAFHRWASRVMAMRECLEKYMEKPIGGGHAV